MTAAACRQLGANSVTLIGTRESRLERGRRVGADHTVNVREEDPVEAVMRVTEGRGVDLAIECSGAVGTPQQCVEVVKRGGRILIVAFYPGGVELDMSAVVRGDMTIYTTRGEGGNNVKRAVSLARQHRLPGEELVTHRFPLDEIDTAFEALRARDGDPIKVVIVP
jgi:L-iditol 2-dehydrogenase